MTCSGRYAEAWAYAAFWCVGSILTGVDDSGGAGNPSLQDNHANFINLGIEANVGMVIYNTTQSTSGPITAVDTHTVTATGVTWDNGDAYRVVAIDANEIATIEHYLNVTASNVHIALAASGACDCTKSSWAYNGIGDGSDYLGKINIIEAGAFHQCPCARPLNDESRRLWLEWSNEQLEQLRTGKLETCQGETGSEFPVVGWAQQSVTEWNAATILANSILEQDG